MRLSAEDEILVERNKWKLQKNWTSQALHVESKWATRIGCVCTRQGRLRMERDLSSRYPTQPTRCESCHFNV